MQNLRIIWRDFLSLGRVCGWLCAMRWLFHIALRLRECRRQGNLQPADQAMGSGPFAVKAHGGSAKISGHGSFSGLREIWARDVYLKGDYLQLPSEGVVVDLGANMGNFSNLALAHSPNVRVVAVEPGLTLNEQFRHSVGQNGWLDRVSLSRHFVGATTEMQTEMLADPQYQTASFLTQDELIAQYQLETIDFLKCDIEGSEFGLLTPESPILARTRQLAIEIHDNYGDRHAFLKMLKEQGFEVEVVSDAAEGCIALAKRALSSRSAA